MCCILVKLVIPASQKSNFKMILLCIFFFYEINFIIRYRINDLKFTLKILFGFKELPNPMIYFHINVLEKICMHI